MADGTCAVDECGTYGRIRRGLCGRHYQAWMATDATRPRCAAPDCARGTVAGGLCTMHYSRRRITGTTAERVPPPRMTAEQKQARRRAYYERVEKPRAKKRRCRIEGCERPANKTAELCVSCHWRIKRYGDPFG